MSSTLFFPPFPMKTANLSFGWVNQPLFAALMNGRERSSRLRLYFSFFFHTFPPSSNQPKCIRPHHQQNIHTTSNKCKSTWNKKNGEWKGHLFISLGKKKELSHPAMPFASAIFSSFGLKLLFISFDWVLDLSWRVQFLSKIRYFHSKISSISWLLILSILCWHDKRFNKFVFLPENK